MERERIVLGDILTPQEHNWRGASPEFTPTKDEEWFISDGVLRRKITLEEARAGRENKRFVIVTYLPSFLGVSGDIAMSLEAIDETTGQTINDPRILLAVLNRETNEIVPVVDEATGEARDLTSELIEKFREGGQEGMLHLRPQSTGEGQNPSLGEGNTGYSK